MNEINLPKTVFISTAILGIVSTVTSYLASPNLVAIHFNSNGVAQNFTSPVKLLLIWLVVNCFVFAVFYVSAHILRRIPASMLNIPNKEFWLSEQNWDKAIEKLESKVLYYGTATMFFFTSILGMVTAANLSEPVILNFHYFWLSFSSYMFYTVYWLISLVQSFKVPKAQLV